MGNYFLLGHKFAFRLIANTQLNYTTFRLESSEFRLKPVGVSSLYKCNLKVIV